ncbi:MAG: glycerophosphodiester phosphodiesterase [Rhodospirillaceae bacterium]
MLNIAHRGARGVAPENTVAAIDKAAQLGADAVEIDVQLSADGEVVVMHDDDLVRCTDVRQRFPDRMPWRVCDLSAAEIRCLDAGSWFVTEMSKPVSQRPSWLQSLSDEERDTLIPPEDVAHYTSGCVQVPFLGECLDACRRLQLGLHIELKLIPRFYPHLAEKVVGEVLQSGMHDAVLISSFDHATLARVRKLSPLVRTAVLTTERLGSPAAYLARLGASAYNPGCYGDYDTVGFGALSGELDRETIAEVRSAGCDVYVWTENDPERMERLMRAGVSGIYTDYPHRLRGLLDAEHVR